MRTPLFPRHRAWRWLRLAVFALAALYGAYLVGGNLFLNTAWGERAINRKPDRFRMQWASGRTWWPGRVSLEDVRLQGQARRIAWHAQAAQVRGRIALWPLLQCRLHVPWVEAQDVTGGLARLEKELPSLPPREGGWALQFDRIAVGALRGGEIDGWRLQGQGEAVVGFYKQLRGGPMELMPSTLRFRDLSATRGGTEWLRGGDLQAGFSLARHRREQAAGVDKLLLTDLAVKLAGVTPGLDVSVDREGKVTMAQVPGEGRADIDLGYARGVLRPGSRLQWSMPLTGHDATGARKRDAVGLAIAVDRDIAVKATVPAHADGRLSLDADLRLRGNRLPVRDFATLLPRASGHVVADWHFSTLRWLSGLFPQATWLQLDGAGDVSANVRVVDGRLAAGSRIGVPAVDAVADVMGNRIRGRARADIRLEAGPQGTLRPRMDAVMERFHVASAKAPGRPYVQGRDLRLTLDADGDPAQVKQTLKARVVFDDAEVPDLRVYNPFLPRRHMRFDGGSGRLSGDLSLDAAGEVGHGSLRIRGRQARMFAAGIALRGDVDIGLRLRRADLRRQAFVADGSTVEFRDIAFSEPGGEARSGWWARLRLDRARLDVGAPLEAGGQADIAMKDVGFLLALFSRRKEYPAWVYKLVDAGQAQADGRLQWRDDVLVLDRVRASNERFGVQARLRLQGQHRQGDLYAQWRALSMGVELDGANRRFHLVRAREWYEGRPSLLK